MPTKSIPYIDTKYFSKLICDYISDNNEDSPLKNFYNRFPNLENFKKQLEEKQHSISEHSRRVLSKRIMYQYGDNSISQSTLSNIDLLQEPNTFTVTTGHQLNLFTGPLYFLYKIFSTINLTEKLNHEYPKHHFVPIYWMATEDHDFEEINYFNYYNPKTSEKSKKIQWNKESGGAVGEFSTDGLKKILAQLKEELGNSENAKNLIRYFSESYLKHDNLADATRYLANCLFCDYGLVIVDGNDPKLKKEFAPYVEKELRNNLSHEIISKTTEKLTNLDYPEQVHPREINLFYIKNGLRERIIKRDDTFYINETDISFSEIEILEELNEFPERFSPNALLRPLYEEVILPNLCYIGGGGELAYWFQLKEYFEAVKIPYPILLLRNSALLVPESIFEKLDKFDVEIEQLFMPQSDLITQQTKKLSKIHLDFSPQKNHLQKQFKDLYKLAEKTDASFLGAVAAQEKKQLNGLDNLQKRLLKAQKRKLADQLGRLTHIQDGLFPNNSLQERVFNFSGFYLEYGEDLLEKIKDNLNPLEMNFTIIEL